MLHGGNVSVHNRPESLVLPVQHAPSPGGRLPHPDPPHVPHAIGQHTLPVLIPVKHSGSDVIDPLALGLGDGIIYVGLGVGDTLWDAVGETDGDTLEVGDETGDDTLEDGVVGSEGEADDEGGFLGRMQGAPT
eukprot:GFKZ01010951.1.p3 GENE.GFKZ01010951.1~~GFKZ01010951.1.p3  ORF type:complete len:133 (-),score=11.93 GFKZ01010951.1:150-548(-)